MSLVEKINQDMMMKINDASFNSSLIKEASDREIQIQLLIREKYSASQEWMLFRKKIAGTLPDEDWNIYNNFVEECVAKVDNPESGENR